jgi:hypothetical protein
MNFNGQIIESSCSFFHLAMPALSFVFKSRLNVIVSSRIFQMGFSERKMRYVRFHYDNSTFWKSEKRYFCSVLWILSNETLHVENERARREISKRTRFSQCLRHDHDSKHVAASDTIQTKCWPCYDDSRWADEPFLKRFT